jgi:hypothetical protein
MMGQHHYSTTEIYVEKVQKFLERAEERGHEDLNEKSGPMHPILAMVVQGSGYRTIMN